jgi:predicted transcriptional regulator
MTMTPKAAKLPRNPKLAESPVAMTLRLDRDTYRRLSAFAARGATLRTHQEIMKTALIEHLERHKA